MANLCWMVGCNGLGTKACAACSLATYCSADCQKRDWKVHKCSCMNIKKLPTTLLPMSEISEYLDKLNAQVEILKSQNKCKEAITLLKSFVAFADHQFGVHIEGTSCSLRSNGYIIDDYLLIDLRIIMASFYLQVDHDIALKKALEAREMIEHRERSQDFILIALSRLEGIISGIYMMKEEVDLAEHHNKQGMMFARLVKGECRIASEYQALNHLSNIRVGESRYAEAIDLCEKAYVLVSEKYGPVHREVQEAASELIGVLIKSGDYARADDYCRMNYENLTDPRNGLARNDSQIADAMMQIADLWMRKDTHPDKEAARALADEAEDFLRRSFAIANPHRPNAITRYDLLGDILLDRSKFTDECRIVLAKGLSMGRSQKLDIIKHLERLVFYHDKVSESMLDAEERDRELKILD